VPDEAVVYENAQLNSVFVVQSSLKVMLEKDYLAANKNKAMEQYSLSSGDITKSVSDDKISSMSSKIIKQIVIPALEKEVNEGKNFAGLRQVYQSLILAAWYKKNLKDNVLAKGYVDRNKTLGIDTQDKQITEKIYKQYLRAYRKGVYNYIKEEIDSATQQMIPRKYFSGGFAGHVNLATATEAQAKGFNGDMAMRADKHLLLTLGVGLFLATSLFSGVAQASSSADNLNRQFLEHPEAFFQPGTAMPNATSAPQTQNQYPRPVAPRVVEPDLRGATNYLTNLSGYFQIHQGSNYTGTNFGPTIEELNKIQRIVKQYPNSQTAEALSSTVQNDLNYIESISGQKTTPTPQPYSPTAAPHKVQTTSSAPLAAQKPITTATTGHFTAPSTTQTIAPTAPQIAAAAPAAMPGPTAAVVPVTLGPELIVKQAVSNGSGYGIQGGITQPAPSFSKNPSIPPAASSVPPLTADFVYKVLKDLPSFEQHLDHGYNAQDLTSWLNSLSNINHQLGYQPQLHQYQKYSEEISNDIQKINTVLAAINKTSQVAASGAGAPPPSPESSTIMETISNVPSTIISAINTTARSGVAAASSIYSSVKGSIMPGTSSNSNTIIERTLRITEKEEGYADHLYPDSRNGQLEWGYGVSNKNWPQYTPTGKITPEIAEKAARGILTELYNKYAGELERLSPDESVRVLRNTYRAGHLVTGHITPQGTIERIRDSSKSREKANLAMLSYGGIDLEKLILNTKGDGGVRTAFSEPRILQMLLDAKGLFPQIQSIEIMTVPMVNILLGFNVPANDNNPMDAPDKPADSKASFMKASLIDIRNKNSIYS